MGNNFTGPIAASLNVSLRLNQTKMISARIEMRQLPDGIQGCAQPQFLIGPAQGRETRQVIQHSASET
jgi:hypothetical protein